MIREKDEYYVRTKFDVTKTSEKMLYLGYQPLVGPKAISLYKMLTQELLTQSSLSDLVLEHERITKVMNMTIQELNKARQALEAVGLVETFKIENGMYEYYLCEPLSFTEFSKVTHFYNLWKSIIGDKNTIIHEFILKPSEPNEEHENMSTSFSSFFNISVEQENNSSKEKLKQFIIDEIGQSCDISDEVVEVLAAHHATNGNNGNSLSKDQIRSALATSIVFSDTGRSIVDSRILHRTLVQQKGRKTFISVSKQNVFKITQPTELSEKLSELSHFSPLEYIPGLIKIELSPKDASRLRTLMYEHDLENEWINMIAEFTIYKNSETSGTGFNINYFFLVCKTISGKRTIFRTSLDLLNHLKQLHQSTTMEFRRDTPVTTQEIKKPLKTTSRASWEMEKGASQEEKVFNIDSLFSN